MLFPCISVGTATPAASRKVGAKSRFCTSAAEVDAAGIVPGQRTTSGMRKLSSYIHRLSYQPCSPRNHPWSLV